MCIPKRWEPERIQYLNVFFFLNAHEGECVGTAVQQGRAKAEARRGALLAHVGQIHHLSRSRSSRSADMRCCAGSVKVQTRPRTHALEMMQVIRLPPGNMT